MIRSDKALYKCPTCGHLNIWEREPDYIPASIRAVCGSCRERTIQDFSTFDLNEKCGCVHCIRKNTLENGKNEFNRYTALTGRY